jgi:uncharacterized membrane protein YoaK (UPF0700 family)
LADVDDSRTQIYGLIAVTGVFVVLGSEGSGGKRRRSKRRRRRRSKDTKLLPTWPIVLVAIPSFVVVAVFCTILAPFLGLFGLVLAYAVLTDVKRLRGGPDDSSLAPPRS